jgi:GT2 family glycosyltransferase
MFVRRNVFDTVGPFRTGVSEDVDWCRRALKLGFNLGYAPKSVAGHPGRRTWSELERKLHRQMSESYALYRELPLGWLRWEARSWLILLSIVPHLVYIFLTRKLFTLRDRVNAALILFRARWLRFIAAHRLAFRRGRRE